KDAANQEVKKDVSSLKYIALPNWAHDSLLESSSSKPHDESSTKVPEGSENPNPTASSSNPLADQIDTLTVESPIPTDSSPVPTACLNDSPKPSSKARLISKRVANQEETPSLDNILSLTNRFEDILGVTTSSDEAIGVEDNVSNMETTVSGGPTPTLRIHKDHPKSQIIGPMDTPIQTRHKSKEVEEQSFIATICLKTDPALLQFCLFSCFLSQVEPKKVSCALQDPSWVEAMQEDLFQFKIQNVWTLVDCPKGVRPIGTKWVLKNKKDKRGIVFRNEVRLVAQGHTQEEGIDYDEVFAPVARIKAIRLFLAYASFIGFTVYQMDVKSVFLYGTIDEEVYVMQPPGFQDPTFLAKVYKVEKAMYGLHQAPRAWYGTLSKYLLMNGFQRGTIDQTLFIRRQREDLILVQVYVDDIIFGSLNPQLCREFEALMHEKFQMSAMGDLNFFLGL
nr:putative ribonuclease H-like domain-containing protein [Tanacetum cinerariifolium]